MGKGLWSKSAALLAVLLLTSLVSAQCASAALDQTNSTSGQSGVLAISRSTSGRSYAVSLLSKIPIPSGAVRLTSPILAIQPVTGNFGYTQTADVVRYFLLPTWFGIGAFAESHFPHDQWGGAGSSFDGGYHTSDSFSIMPLCTDRHATYCGVTYSGQEIAGHGMELRVDLAVVWMPIHVAHLPATGVVTITGYTETSWINPSSGAVLVTLTTAQEDKLRSALALLRTSPGGTCMENAVLFKLSVAATKGGKVLWSATADLCPGVLAVAGQGGRFLLNDRSCSLDKLVTSFFPTNEAAGTKQGLKVCAPSF